MISREQAQSLAHLVHLLRPAWSEAGIFAALSRCPDRDPITTALAALRAAADPRAQTPGIIPTAGSHWNETAPAEPKPPHLSREERRALTCAMCGAFDGCKPACDGFLPLDHATRDRTHGVALARAELTTSRAHLCSHGVLPRDCREGHETESKEYT